MIPQRKLRQLNAYLQKPLHVWLSSVLKRSKICGALYCREGLFLILSLSKSFFAPMAVSRVSFLTRGIRAYVMLILLSSCSRISADCFLPNGTIPDGQSLVRHPAWEYAPCNNDTEVSMCCRTNLPNSDDYKDFCQDDGLCELAVDHTVWRVACTDATWKSDACINLCTTGYGMIISTIIQ